MAHQNGAAQEHAGPELHLYLNRDLYTSEVTHRIANSLCLLASTVSLRARHLTKQPRLMSSHEVAQLLDEISARIVAVGQLHREIATQPGAAHLDLNEHLRNLCESIIAAVAQPGQFELLPSAEGVCAVKTDKILPICMIVAEAITNSLKYAHPTGVRGTLEIGCRRDADGSAVIEVADDGVGLPEDFDPLADGGLGSRTMDILARQLDAEISFIARPTGLCFRLRLPASMVL
jgi:two-component sensor histidine kinase